MKDNFKIAWKVYLILLTFASVIFWVYMIYDDWVFVKKYGVDAERIWYWFLWYFGYCFISLTLYYWMFVGAGILISRKLKKRLGTEKQL